MLDDRSLLAAEVGLLWEHDSRGRLLRTGGLDRRPAPELVLAVPADGGPLLTACGHAVPAALANDLAAIAATGASSAARSEPPAVLAPCEALLHGALGPVNVRSGPSYLAIPPIAFNAPGVIRRSGDGMVADLRGMAPEASGWLVDEWRDLLDGSLGPWAMALEGGRVVSICWSPRCMPGNAEAGTWTAPDARGRGFAAACTAAWANEFPPGAFLFYSTGAENRSSQGVAARLGLREIGWMWQLFVGDEP